MRQAAKFGGWSVGNPAAIRKSAKVAKELFDMHGPLLLVVSAMKGITDDLKNAAVEVSKGADTGHYVDNILGKYEQTSNELGVSTDYLSKGKEMLEVGLGAVRDASNINAELLDQVLFIGEFLSSEQIFCYYEKEGFNVAIKHPEDLNAVCNGIFGNARLDSRYDLDIARNINGTKAGIIITDGYYYMTEDGKRATIGRGGSDKTAVDYAVRIGSEIIIIGGNTNGVMTADPNIVGKDIAKNVRELSYEEAMACSAHGAKILHPLAIHPILDRGLEIPIHIINTFEEDCVANEEKSTLIRPYVDADKEKPIKVINYLKIPLVLTVRTHVMYGAPGFNRRYYGILENHGIDTLIDPDSYATNTSLIMNPDIVTHEIGKELEGLVQYYGGRVSNNTITFSQDYSLVTLVGEGIRVVTGLSGKVGDVLGRNGIKIKAHSAAEQQICMPYLIEDIHGYEAVRVLHEKFFEG